MIDLHIHSTASDGKLTPREIIDFAIQNKIPAVSITDHDTVAGLKEAKEYAKEKNFEFIPGIEISANPEKFKMDNLHIVGLYINPENKKLLKLCREMENARELQKKRIIRILNKLGYKITFKELKKESNGGVYGRPHIARIILRKYPEKFKVLQDVFDELLIPGAKAYIPQEKKSMKEVIKIIRDSGGIAIIAHPGIYENDKGIIKEFILSGGDGIEINQSYERLKKKKKIEREYKKIARENELIISGGSDYHTSKDTFKIGDFGLTKKEFDLLKKRASRLFLKNRFDPNL